MGDTTRQRILLLFEPGEELSIKDIAAMFDYGRSTIVHHLAVLEKAGVLAMIYGNYQHKTQKQH